MAILHANLGKFYIAFSNPAAGTKGDTISIIVLPEIGAPSILGAPKLNEPATISLANIPYEPDAAYLVDNNGYYLKGEKLVYDASNKSFSFSGHFAAQPRNYKVSLIFKQDFYYPVYNGQTKDVIPSNSIDLVFPTDVSLNSTNQKSRIEFRENGRRIDVLPLTEAPFIIDYTFIGPSDTDQDVTNKIQDMFNNNYRIKLFDQSSQKVVAEFYPHHSSQGMKLYLTTISKSDDNPLYIYYNNDQKQSPLALAYLNIAGAPNISSQIFLKSYSPKDSIKITVKGVVPSILEHYELITKDDRNNTHITFTYQTSENKFKCIIPDNIISGTYDLYWHIKDAIWNLADDYKTEAQITINENRGSVPFHKYFNNTKNFPVLGGWVSKKPIIISDSELKDLRIGFNTAGIGIDNGPQVFFIKTRVFDSKGKERFTTVKRVITYNKNDIRKDAYEAYLSSLYPTEKVSSWYCDGCKISNSAIDINEWETAEVTIVPDKDFYSLREDQIEETTYKYLISGHPIKIDFSIGSPQILGYFAQKKNVDTLDFNFKEVSAQIKATLLNSTGQRFFVSLGFGVLIFDDDANAKKNNRATTTSVGLTLPLSIDLLEVFRFYNWASIADNFSFSLEATPFFPLGTKFNHNSVNYGLKYSRILIGVNASISLTR